MKASIVAASAALVGSVAASHNAHNAFHNRRGGLYESEDGVCTVYTTVYVTGLPTAVANSTIYVYPSPVETSSSSSTPCAGNSSSIYIPTLSSTTELPVYTPASSSAVAYTPVFSVYSEPAPTKEAYTPVYTPAYTPKPKPSKEAVKPKPSKAASPPGSYSETGRIVVKDGKWAVTYTPYTAGGECKSASEVQADIAKIAELGFTTIRSYSTDCGVFENVIPACKEHGLKIIYGIFLEAGGAGGKGPFSEYANSQLQDIIDHAHKDTVAMIIVGNEAIFNHYCTAEELAKYIVYVKEKLISCGFPSDIAVTTTEPVDVWQQYGAALCDVIDVFACQVHPFFTAKVEAHEAGAFAKEQLEMAAAVCPEAAKKGKYITEIGWPTEGMSNGNAKPGYGEQKTAIKSIIKEVGTEACLFSFQDDGWKAPGAFGVEQHFGIMNALY
ncbi:glycoside hydrolase family 17 protein [Amniculicola lignicola CBS 123094]|uniref:Probable beta-glucosidase btgE n=1 Tax=Amniculicola lignicola CBS 123094 TaxID=1392246 RepID=A0A6A5W6S9_9PLEO|nr:glycoside hydrolase family 17 protein [Amniculicola lignicola CBS 123094]